MTVNKQGIIKFKPLWLKYDEENVNCHQIFFKEHSVRKQEPEHPEGKTLFVLNIPPYATTDALKRALESVCGPVATVTFAKQYEREKNSFKTGYIVFKNESGLKEALSLPDDYILILQTQLSPIPTGIMKWCKEYNDSIQDEAVIKKEIYDYVQKYDERIANRLAKEKAIEEGEDNEGWVTVTSRKKRGQFALSRKESAISKIQSKEEEKTRKKQLLNFYSFQIREAKKQNLAELRKKFELDKKKLQQLKSKRTFKPF
ncbi:ribosomal RNA-processing protein 7 homolog A [Orussus abietinus]|uniref:ribosomal RNA-processing protein 7 homolog A n=1 Tax=Orussus abietinus TaxID=222816 RepID=UPI000626B3E3|nr:ribosomal RNA-processing protein 7 homolog A [Orussus abietinus]